jgi:hypothetical protein
MGLLLLGLGSAILISGSRDRWVLLLFVFGFIPAIVAMFGALDLVWRDRPRTTTDESDAPRRRALVALTAMSRIILAVTAAGYVAIAVLVVRLVYSESRHGDLGVALGLLPFVAVAVWRGSTNLLRLTRPSRDVREPRP